MSRMKQYLMEDEMDSERKKCQRKSKYLNGKTKWIRRQILLRIALILLCCLAAVIVFLFFFRTGGGRQLKRAASMTGEITAPEQAETENDGKTVNYLGKQWVYNENMVAILCIGVDTEQFPAESQASDEQTSQEYIGSNQISDEQTERQKNRSQGSYQNGGFADTLFLIAVDTKEGNGVLLPISRYTMGMLDTYQNDGSYGGQEEMQLAYAYAYGDGGKESCENTAKAVSRFLYGIPISGYAALDMSGIAPLNDAVGGVTLDISEDLTDADPAFFQGNTLTLSGEQALRFVRYRISEGEKLETDNNAPRMQRQEQFLQAFAKQFFQQIRKEPGLPLTCYQLLKEYMVTDITPSETLYLSTLLADHGNEISVVSLPGTVQKGEYTEVYVDRERLYEILLDVFYTEK